ncbi:ATP-dependent DNA ligase, partial [Pseudomonas syringae pv. actinidiae]|nr:ATP-dependent DNA ligase [Pseudomonas syringae pv. actinidiae]
MKAFAELYAQLDATTSSNAKLAAMRDYFEHADPQDAAWAVYFLSGGAPATGADPRAYASRPMT